MKHLLRLVTCAFVCALLSPLAHGVRVYDASVYSVDKLSPAALPVTYAKVKKTYENRMGHAFELKEDDTDGNG